RQCLGGRVLVGRVGLAGRQEADDGEQCRDHERLPPLPRAHRSHARGLLLALSILVALLVGCVPTSPVVAPTAMPFETVGPGVQMRLDGAPLRLNAIAGHQPQGIFVMVPLRLTTAPDGVDTSALGPFTLVDRDGGRSAAVRDPWLLKWLSLSLRRLP